MKLSYLIGSIILSLLQNSQGFCQEAPALTGRIGLESVRVPEDTSSAYDRVRSQLALDGSIPFRVGRSRREILYGVALRAWATKPLPNDEVTSPDLTLNPTDEKDEILTELLLERATLEYQRRRWKFRVGQQELVLGEVLGPSVIDLANPRDYRQADQFLKSTDRIPQAMALLEYKRRRYGFQLFVSPRPAVMKLPEKLLGVTIQDDFLSREAEYGARYNYFWSGLDLKFYALHHQNRSPILVPELSPLGLQYKALQRFENSLASTFSYAWDYTVLRGEFIRTVGLKNDPRDLTADQVDQGVLALDYTTESQMLLVGQFQSILPGGCVADDRCHQRQFWGGGQVQIPWFDSAFTTTAFLYRRLDQATVYRKYELLWNVSGNVLAKGIYETYEGFIKDGLGFLDAQDRYLFDLSLLF